MSQYSNNIYRIKGLDNYESRPHTIPNMRNNNESESSLLGLNINFEEPKVNVELFGSFVGTYEQSILSGRMSTLPSKPLWFSLDLGVVGHGDCKPKLKCPPHRSITFPAFYYEFENDAHQATPYVANIDLDGLNNHSKVSGYRIPFKGQLQIIIKNQSNTPIKVFLIPYDLTDMPIFTKTYLRQKVYLTKTITPSTSPMIPINRTVSLSDLDVSGNDRLQYAIHLQIICTKQKRIFIHHSIRVVFSHRTPDRQLRVVTEGPLNPKYFPIDSCEQNSQLKKARKCSFGKPRSEYRDTPLKQEYIISSNSDENSNCGTNEER